MSRVPFALGLAGLSAAVLALLATSGVRAQSPASPDAAALYKKHCLMCHMANGNNAAVKNASFTDGVWAHGSSTDEVALVIKNGVKGTAMLPFGRKLNDTEIQALAKYVRAFDPKLKNPGAK